MNILKDNEFKKHLKTCNFKDKVRKILGIEEDVEEEKILALLETIVEEYSRLEDIEFKKIQVEYELVFNKGVKSVKDKIKAKIEEYEQDVKEFEEYWSKDPRKFKKEKSVDYYKLEALKELLEKE